MKQTVFFNRRQRLFKILEEKKLDVAVFGEPLTFFYLTGTMIKPMERFLALVLNVKKGQCVAIIPTAELDALEDTGIKVRPIGDQESPVDVLASCVGAKDRLGVQMGGGYNMIYSMALGRQLFARFGTDIEDLSDVIADMRLTKDKEELRLLQENADLTDRTLELAKKQWIHVGAVDAELSMSIYQEFWKAQARPDMPPLVQVGPVSALPHGDVCGQRAREGDVVLIDFGSCYQNYHADMTRTFFLGDPGAKLRHIYQVVLEAHLAAISAAKAGIPCGRVDQVARAVITDAGYGPYFTHRVGHGLGLAAHEAPSIHGENRRLIQEGMVFTVEPGIYIPGVGGVRIEDDVYIEGGVAHSFNHFPKDMASMILDI